MTLDELVERLGALERARGIEASAEATLEALYNLDTMRMLEGACLAEPALADARAVLSSRVRQQIERLIAERPRAARHWLGYLWSNMRPPSLDMSAWQKQLGIPDSRTEYARQVAQEQEQRVAELLGHAALDVDAPAPDGLDAVFGVTLPTGLVEAWRRAGSSKPKGTTRYLATIRDVLSQTAFVAFEEIPMRQLEQAYPPPAMPPFIAFAKARNTILFLDLTRPSGEDFAVCRFLHDHGDESKVTAPTSAAWLKRQKS